jgi:demethylmenaquinone methyltransferase/2-methoxy-6-polyprenyl-1,4-benzoquinol methylase
MSSYVLMKVLESTPERYDRGIQLLSRGRIGAVHGWVADHVAAPGRRVLDIGCGTGGLSLACAARGASVVGIDINAGMLEVARSKLPDATAGGIVEWVELGAAEIEDRFDEASLDAIVSCLAFSELSADERAYVLRVSRTRLRPGGTLAIADEVLPEDSVRRFLFRLQRIPVVTLTWLLTQTTTRPVDNLSALVRETGFVAVEEHRLGGHFSVVVAQRAEAGQ